MTDFRAQQTEPSLSRRHLALFLAHTHPSDGFFNDSALTLYLSLHNPTPTEFITYDETTRPEQIATVLEALERDPPAYISLLPVPLGPAVAGDPAAPFRRFVYDHYALAKVVSQRSLNTNSSSGADQRFLQKKCELSELSELSRPVLSSRIV